MAVTGISVSDEVIAEFEDFKLRKTAKFITYKIESNVIVTDCKGDSDRFEDFLNCLPPNEARYAVYDLDYTTSDGRASNKLVLVAWSPDSGSVKNKMVYAGSKDALIRALNGISIKITATDLGEISLNILIDACRKV